MEKLIRWFRMCGSCGSSFGPIDGFCERCFEDVIRRASALSIKGFPFAAHSLLKWDEKNEIVGDLVRCLKGKWSQKGCEIIAGEIARIANLKGRTIIVPPSKSEEQDHAWNLGNALAKFGGCDFASPFSVESKAEQKSLDKSQRLSLRFSLVHRLVSRNFLFVDDLITTGSTARAAWIALGSPKNFEAWTVAHRSLRSS